MIRYILQVCVFFLCVQSGEALGQKKEKPAKEPVSVLDSIKIEYYDVEIGVNQKNYMEQLAGNWVIDTMHRQARAVPEALHSVTLSFDTDSTFSGSTGCNKVTGTFRLKGTSIKFLTIHSTKMACEQLDREAALQRLLTHTVSAYTVDGDVLLLRDGSSNVVFRAHRKRD
jgi:heat shock protein HslJ